MSEDKGKRLVLTVKDMDERSHVVNVDLDNLFSFDELTFDQALTEQAATLGWWSTLLAWKEREVSIAKADYDVTLARVYLRIRTEFEAGDKKVTETLLDKHVTLDEEADAALRLLNKLKAEAQILSGVTQALRARTSTLITYGANLRATSPETGGEMRVYEPRPSARAAMASLHDKGKK